MEHYTEETDNTTKNIVHEIVRECASLDLEIDANFCTYYVKLLTLDPIWNISPERKINRDSIQILVSFIIEKIKLVESPSLTTIKMQQHFLSHFQRKETMIQNQRQILKACADPLLENLLILACTDANKARLYKRVVLYISLMIDLGSPKNYQVFKETNTAFRSIIDDPRDFYEFGTMKSEEKLSYIENLQSIVFGIRLFNRDSGRSVAEIDDMPRLITQALVTLNADFVAELKKTTDNINLTTRATENMFYLYSLCRVGKNGPHGMEIQLNKTEVLGITDEDVTHVMEMLVMFRQYAIYIRRLIARLQEIEESTKNHVKELVVVLHKLRHSIKYNIGIATCIVFPLFIELGKVWRKFQDEFIVLSQCGQIFVALRQFLSNERLDKEKIDAMLEEKGEIEEHSSTMMSGSESLSKIVETHLSANVQFAFSGFCIWWFTESKGALIPGNSQIGVKWENEYYIFAHSEAAYVFTQGPERMILKAYNIIRKKPELIAVLRVQAELIACRHISIFDDTPETVRRHHTNKMLQTDLHPIKSYIDPNYTWNTWDYYHKALKTATILGYQTHSVQTVKSNFRYSLPVQTSEQREKACQTTKHNYMNVATPSNFFFGLKGRRDDTQHIIELTRPIDEHSYRNCATSMSFPPPCQTESEPCYKSTKKKSGKFHPPAFLIPKSSADVSARGEDAEVNDLSACVCVQEVHPPKK